MSNSTQQEKTNELRRHGPSNEENSAKNSAREESVSSGLKVAITDITLKGPKTTKYKTLQTKFLGHTKRLTPS